MGNKNGLFCSPGEVKMKLIVESGATKTAWRSLDSDGVIRKAQSGGMNPSSLNMDAVRAAFRSVMPELSPEGRLIRDVHFYGAGLVSDEASAPIRECLEMWCPTAEVSFHSDMLAAARALFGDGSGIVAIMGTGSNSCLYENGSITANISPGGYILGDEGGAVWLGKALLADFIKGLLPQDVENEFIKEYALDYPTIVRKVYREPAAAAFMASFAPFVMARLSDPHMRRMAETCVQSFIGRALARYEPSDGKPLKVGVVGSFGCACEGLLRESGGRCGLEFSKFLKSPIDELVKYHGI